MYTRTGQVWGESGYYVILDRPLEALHHDVSDCYWLVAAETCNSRFFFGIGMMVSVLKHDGMMGTG